MIAFLKRRVVPLVFFGFIVALTVSIIELIGYGFDIIQFKLNLPVVSNNVIVTSKFPAIESPPTNALLKPSRKLKTALLTATPYVVNANIMSDEQSYQKFSTHLLLNGNFDQALLHIRGTVIESGRHFIYLNYGNVGGVISGVRFSVTALNESQTLQNGGVFTSASPIDVTLDLLGTVQLATTRNEYAKNHQATKFVNLWQLNTQPPTYINLVAAPFNESGVFGGAQLSMELQYSCTDGDKCLATTCPLQDHVYDCMTKQFGADAANEWCKNVDCAHAQPSAHPGFPYKSKK